MVVSITMTGKYAPAGGIRGGRAIELHLHITGRHIGQCEPPLGIREHGILFIAQHINPHPRDRQLPGVIGKIRKPISRRLDVIWCHRRAVDAGIDDEAGDDSPPELPRC